MKDIFKLVFGVAAVLVGIAAIISLVQNAEMIMGFIAITFGVMALIWTWRARKKMSPSSSIRRYISYFFACLVFVLLFSILSTLEQLFFWQQTRSLMVYPKYFLISLAYIMFVLSAYKILIIAKEFGFEIEAKEIARVLKKRK